MKFLRFLKSRIFLINLAIAIALVFIVLFIISSTLNTYTRHGESLTVPNLVGMTMDQAMDVLNKKNLRYAVRDSSFYNDKPKMSILEQDPQPDSKVKEGRVIYLTINAATPPKVKMPNLVDVSYQQALVILESKGLKAGELIYKPNPFQNLVLNQLYRGRPIKQDEMLDKGSVIDLELGDGLGKTSFQVPDLIGLTYDEAMVVLKGSALNIGSVVFENDVKDSTNAIVDKQNPVAEPGANISQGQTIDIFLKKDE